MDTVKSKLASAATSRKSEAALQQETEKYRLMVTAGPSYDPRTHETVAVNTSTPTTVENAFVTAKIKVRVRGFHGLPSHSPPHSVYFDSPVHARDQYSVAFSFVPKIDLPCVDTVWGNDFDHPIRDKIPPLFNTAFRIVKEFIDPGLECDAYADEPWLYGPSLSCWFAFRVGEMVGEDANGFEAPSDEDVMREGADGDGAEVRRKLGLPDKNEKRRKHFLSLANREAFTFEKGRVYSGDFYNPYLDFPNFSLKLPGFSLKVIKYVDQKSHCLRYVFKNRRTGDVYFNVNFHLLWGQQLERAMEQDRKGEKKIPIWPGGVVSVGEEDEDQTTDKQDVADDGVEEDDESERDVFFDAPEARPENTATTPDIKLVKDEDNTKLSDEKDSIPQPNGSITHGDSTEALTSPPQTPKGHQSKASRLSGDLKQLVRNVSKRENKGNRLSMIRRFSWRPDEQTET